MTETEDIVKTDETAPQVGGARPGSLWPPFAALRTEVDRLFDTFWPGLGPGAMTSRGEADLRPLWRPDVSVGRAVPAMDVVETEKEFRIKAELPGLDASNVELALSNDVLTIRGEKKDEREEKAEHYHLSERRFGAFRRSFQLPPGVDRARIEASFDNGVLTVALPKTDEAAAAQRKIDIRQKT